MAFWQQALLASLLMYGSTALGAALVFVSDRCRKNFLTVLTGGAAGIMLAASFFSLLLPALEYGSAPMNAITATAGFVLGGGSLMVSDALFSHLDLRFGDMGRKNGLMYIAVTLHNIPEGMAVGVAFAGGGAAAAALVFAVGIAIQNFPEGACVAFPLRAGGMSSKKAFFLSQLSGAVEIPSCVLGALAATLIEGLMPWALSFSAGAMVAVICAELIPECFEQKKSLASFGILAGFAVMMILDVLLG